MAETTSILNADRGRAFTAALVFLCALAAAQILLVARALILAEAPAAPAPAPSARIAPPEPGTLAAPAPAPVIANSFGPPPIGSFELPQPRMASPPAQPAAALRAPAITPPAARTPATPSAAAPGGPPVHPSLRHLPPPGAPAAAAGTGQTDDPASTMSFEELVELAKQVRSLGDMQGALEVLRKADLRFPARPEVMAEMAQCYEQMGLDEKAGGLWRQLRGMDPAQGGGWRDLARRRLDAPASPQGFSRGLESSPQALSLGACRARREASFTNGEKVVLNIPVLRRGNTPVDPSQVDINVFFFDRVNGREIAQTIADDPPTAWTSPPVDWSGIGEEPLEVTYLMPNLSPGEVAAHGKRAFHGYVVRLYYQNKLQDVAAEPRDLLDFGSPAPRTDMGGVNPLLPPAAP